MPGTCLLRRLAGVRYSRAGQMTLPCRTHLVGVCVLVTVCTIMLVIFMVVAEL